MAKIRDWLIRALGGHTEAEWQRDIASMRGSRTPVKLGLTRRLPVGVTAEEFLVQPVDGADPLMRENMAYRLGRMLLDLGMIDYRTEAGRGDELNVLRASVFVYPPEAET